MCSMKARKQKLHSTFNRQVGLFEYYSCLPYESPLSHLTPFTPQQAQTRKQTNKYFLIAVLECFIGSKEKSTAEEGGGKLLWGGKRKRHDLLFFFFPYVLHVRVFGSLVSNTAGSWNKLFRDSDHSFCCTFLIAATRKQKTNTQISVILDKKWKNCSEQ